MFMKKNLFFSVFALTILCVLEVSAAPEGVTAAKARTVAAKVLRCEAPVEVEFVGEYASLLETDDKTGSCVPYYIYKGKEKGFVIVSADDRFPTVLGYSDSSQLSSINGLPPAMVAYMKFCSRYISDVRAGVAEAPLSAATGNGVPVVAPLLTTQWGQEMPYNGMCPTEGGRACYVGCVATAMAQIMKYWNWPKHGRGFISYTHSTLGTLSSNFEKSEYDWSNMYNTTLQNSKSDVRRNAVAKLSYDCGVATRMNYSADGSGTTSSLARIALSKYLGYAASKMIHVYRDCFDGTQEDYNNIIYSELRAGRPVLYAAFSSKGGGKDAGHAFVFDGYDSEGLVHVNWGWDGSADGYYAIPLLNPVGMGYEFTDDQEMVYGIQPDVEWNDAKEDQIPLKMHAPQAVDAESLVLGGNFVDTIYNIYNYSGSQRSYYISVALCNENGEIENIVGRMQNGERVSLPYYSGYNSLPIKCTIPTSIPDGKYGLKVVCKEFSNSADYDWIFPNTVGGSINNWIPVVISGKVVTFNSPDGPSAPNVIDAVSADVMATTYYDLQGRMILNPSAGSIVIRRQTLSNGTTKSSKIIMR